MTALPLRLKQMHGREGARLRPWRVCRAVAVLALAFVFAGGAQADDPIKGEVKVFTDGGFTRLVFRLDREVEAKVSTSGAIMIISFKKPVEIAVDRLNASAPDYISAARRVTDGTAIRTALARKVKVNTKKADEHFLVNLMPEAWKSMWPSMPQEVVDERKRRELDPTLEFLRQSVEEAEKAGPSAAHTRERLVAMRDFFETMTRWYEGVRSQSTERLMQFVRVGEVVRRLTGQGKSR